MRTRKRMRMSLRSLRRKTRKTRELSRKLQHLVVLAGALGL